MDIPINVDVLCAAELCGRSTNPNLGWLEYFIGSKNASFFAPAIQDVANVVVPTISIV